MLKPSNFIKCLDDCPVKGPHNCKEYPWPCMVKEGYAKAFGLTIVYDIEKYEKMTGCKTVFSKEGETE